MAHCSSYATEATNSRQNSSCRLLRFRPCLSRKRARLFAARCELWLRNTWASTTRRHEQTAGRWGSQLKGNNRVTVATFGDGATNIGAFHESLNLASVWKLPVIFLCQNNLYSEHTTYEKATAAKRVADRAAAYNMPGVRVNGNDPVEMYAAAREAVDRARAGDGPTLIEAMTFRFYGHVFGDADAYMDKGQKQAAMDADPVPLFRARLIAEGIATEAELVAIEAEIETRIDTAVEFALASAFPDLGELTRDVYAEGEVA